MSLVFEQFEQNIVSENVPESAICKIKDLTERLNAACDAYYLLNQEIMSDRTYDQLLDELQQLENEHGLRLSNSPTYRVGSPVVSKLKKVDHEIKLLSLDKTKDAHKLMKFLDFYEGLLSPKKDGLSLVATYDKGRLEILATRGDGEIGEDVTHNARAVSNLPATIPCRGRLIVIGEGIVSYSDFRKINDSLHADERYSSPRALAAGSIRQLDSAIAAKRHVRFAAFRAVSDKEFALKSEALSWIKTLGFDVVEYKKVNRRNLGSALNHFEATLKESDVPVDGLVLTVDDVAVSKKLGATAKYPRDSFAYKWQDNLVETTLLDVVWQTGRTGVITPVAKFAPVDMDGKTVVKASLHNVSILKNLELGIGDTIGIYDANMVIPQVGENYTRSNTIEIPETCPECSGPARVEKPKEAEHLVCITPECPAKLVQRLKLFVCRDALNIDGVSVMTLESFVEKEIIRDLPDIFLLASYQDEIESMPGFGKKSFSNMIESIDRARQNVHLRKFIYSLGIKHIGRTASNALCEFFGDDLEAIIAAEIDELYQVENFGDKLASSVYGYFRNEDNLQLVRRLLAFINIRRKEESVVSDTTGLAGKTFAVTGKVEQFENRSVVRAFIEQNGGHFGSSVTGNTDFLVTNDPYSGSSKNRKAQELGVEIITEQQLLEMVQ